MESQPQNPEFRNNPENFHPCTYAHKSLPRSCTSMAFSKSGLTGFLALKHNLFTLVRVSSPDRVVRSIHVTALSNQAA